MNKNKKGIELAISTLILIVLGVLILIGLVYAVTRGFDIFQSSTEPFVSTTEVSAVREACSLACVQEDKITFCCEKFKVQGSDIKCSDARLEIDCVLSCEDLSCS